MDAISLSASSTCSSIKNTIPRPKPLPPSTTTRLFLRRLRLSSVRIEQKPQSESSTATTVHQSNPTPAGLHPPPTATTTKKSSSPATSTTPPPPVGDIDKKKAAAVPSPSLPATLFNVLDSIVNNFIDPPRGPSVDPKYVLADNFAPVDELPPTDCPIIEGQLPSCLQGAYIRNGPNPQHIPRGPHHLFDGDGMLHCLRISNGRATFCSRYVKTYKFNVEQEAGAPIVPNFFSGFYTLPGAATRGALAAAKLLTGQLNLNSGFGLANTSLAYFGKRLYALGESDLPYAVRVTEEGDIQTIGRCDFEGKLSLGMTAHPKIDPQTGEVFAFRYVPFLTLFRFDSQGSKLLPDVPIFSLSQPTFLHDFAITKRYAVIPDIQVVVNPTKMIFAGKSPVGADPEKVPRVGVIPRYATSEAEMRWFKVPGFNLIHTINAWEEEEEDAIVLVGPNILSIEHALEEMELVHCTVEMVRIELKTGKVWRKTVSSQNLDFGVINPAYVGRKNRYAYMGVGDPMPKISGVAKLDFEAAGKEVVRLYGEGCYGGEPFFVAKENPAAEDDGYVVSYVHDENRGESRFVVMDAQSRTLEVVASVKLPRRVPYGFHGLFVGEKELQSQLHRQLL